MTACGCFMLPPWHMDPKLSVPPGGCQLTHAVNLQVKPVHEAVREGQSEADMGVHGSHAFTE